jgi:hypothetical protein
VGGIATIQGRPPAEDDDVEFLGINVRLYAKTELGQLAIDPLPVTYLTAIPHAALRPPQRDDLVDLLRAPEFLHPEIEGRTQAPWRGVIEELRKTFGIETDAETLQSLEFEVLIDSELQRTLEGVDE